MRRNGTLKVALVSADIENEYGEQLQGDIRWTQPYDCLIVTNSDNRIGKYEDGEFRMSAYTVLIEGNKEFYDALVDEDGSLVVTEECGESVVIKSERPVFDRISLSRYGEYLGEFRVQSSELFPSVGRIQLNVV